VKSAEESDFVYSLSIEQRIIYWRLRKQNQLDALKGGMRRAAALRPTMPHQNEMSDDISWGVAKGYNSGTDEFHKIILSAADALTEKEL